MRLTRRQLVGVAAATAAGAAGVYELLDRFAEKPARPEVTGPHPKEQHVLDGVEVVVDEGVEVLVPPLHHRVVTARITVDATSAALREARRTLEQVLASLDAEYPATPAGVAVAVAWGLPYFRRYVPGAARREIPVDLRATAQRRREVRVLEDAGRFPSDSEETILEGNDVAVFLRSDHLQLIDAAEQRLFHELAGILSATSIRSGFAGGGFGGKRSIPKRMATAAGVPGSELMPPTAELFFGFTSTAKHALGPTKIANFETLGYADLRSPYFVGGTHMHLSHIHEDMLAWYLNHDHGERVDAMFRPGLEVGPTKQTLSQSPDDALGSAELRRDFARHKRGRACRLDPAGVAPRPRCRWGGRHPVPQGHCGTYSALTSTRSTIRSPGAPIPHVTRCGTNRPAAFTSSSSTPRVTTSGESGWRWTACCRTALGSRSSRDRAPRGSTPCSTPHTGRTSSSHRGGTVSFPLSELKA